MSRKNTLAEKRARRMSRALRRGRLPSFINLVQWLMDRGYAKTKAQAKEIIMDKRVMFDSHPLGVRARKLEEGGTVDEFDPIVTARIRSGIRVKE